jgi:orotidine-5'-phosphate decarboxylase
VNSPIENSPGPRIIVALDYPQATSAIELARALDPELCRLKVGKELFTSAGPRVVETLHELGFEVFLDLKFHDIPNTVAAACRSAAHLGVWMLNVHASGGETMMNAAREAIEAVPTPPLLIAVTVLTSLDDNDLASIGLACTAQEQVLRLATLSANCALDGVVCSAADLNVLRGELPSDFLTVTPGVRPSSSAQGDQKRITTPTQAIELGASYLVIGRPITQAARPIEALAEIVAEVTEA